MKKLLAIILFLAFCYIVASYGQDRGRTEIRRGGGISPTNSPGNGTPALFLTAVTNADGSTTFFYAAPSATATNAQAPSQVLSNLVVTVGSNVTNAHANIGTISVGTLYPNAVLSNLVVNVANTVTNVNANQGNITSGTLNISSGALLSNVVFFGTITNRGVLIFTNVATAGAAPSSGQTKVFGSNDTIYSLNSAGTLTDLAGGSGAGDITGGAATQFSENSGVLNIKNGALLTNILHYNTFSNLGGIVVNNAIDGGNNVFIYNNGGDLASDTIAFHVAYDAASDPQSIYAAFGNTYNVEESYDFYFSQTRFNIGSFIASQFGGSLRVDGNTTNNGGTFHFGTNFFHGATTFTNKVMMTPFTVPNNVSTVYGTNGNLQVRTLTNSSTLSFLEMGDGQTIELLVTNRFETNILSFSGLANTNFIDGFFGLIPSNRLVKFFVQRVGTHTNISYQGPVIELLAGSNIAFSTNTDTSITIGVTGLAGGVDGRFDTLIVTNWSWFKGGVSNMLWVFNNSGVSNMSWVFNASGVSNMLWTYNGGPVTNAVGVTTLGSLTNIGAAYFGSVIWATNTGNFLADIDVTGLGFFRTNTTTMGTNNVKWLNVTNNVTVGGHATVTGGFTNLNTANLGNGIFLVSGGPLLKSMGEHQFSSVIHVTNLASFYGGVYVSNVSVRKNIEWVSATLTATSQQTNVITDFSQGVWDAGNWDTNLNFLHATNGTVGLSETPTNLYTTIKIWPKVNVKVKFPTTWNLLGGVTNNCTLTNGVKFHIVFTSNGNNQTNVDVSIIGASFP